MSMIDIKDKDTDIRVVDVKSSKPINNRIFRRKIP